MLRIVMESRSGLAVPTVVCDHCEREIEEGDKGVYAWLPTADDVPLEMLHFHAGSCVLTAERDRDVHYWTEMLGRLPAYLRNNLKVDESSPLAALR